MKFQKGLYWFIKKRIFPVRQFLDIIPEKRNILDIGCGNGIFSALLSRKFPDARITGIDIDKKKIYYADRYYRSNHNLCFIHADIAGETGRLPAADLYLMVDLLYLLPQKTQNELVQKIAETMDKSAVLIIKECAVKPRYKYLWNYFQETVSVKVLGHTLGSTFYFRSEGSMIKMLEDFGYLVKVFHLDHGYLYPHIAYFCTRA